jgi:outer membrane lipoprotein-sorting protein
MVMVFAGITASANALQAQDLPSVQDVVDHIDDLYRAQSSHAIMTMTVTRERGTRELTLESWSRGDDEALIVIREPAREAGTATLRTEEGLWNYAPRADRLIRIPTGLLSDSWMGSHFTNDDLLRETSYMDDHEGTVAWIEEDGERRLEVTLTPHPDAPVVYTRLVFTVIPDLWIPTRADYYDDSELVRSMTFDQVRQVENRRIPMHMILQPADDENERTEILYNQLELNVPVDPELFTRRGLRRVAQD